MVIPRIGVNAPVNVRVVGPDGRMGEPNGRFDVIWYDFGNFSGMGGFPGVPGANSIFSGHVDYHPHYTAVFWDLRQLVPGDIIDVYLRDGSLVRYSVQWARWIDPSVNFANYAFQTGEELVTIVTCVGTFSSATRQYSNRLAVRGVRIW
jgi:LPXTG-site transpeptidase (sortase) family protein